MCSIAHEGVARPALARIRILFDEFQEETPISASICFQCTSAAADATADAACMEACPKGAMSRDERTGAVAIDEVRCIGCMLCQKACPWDVPQPHPERRLAIVCDLCAGRVEGPICVQMCPLSGKALRYEVAVAESAPRAGVPACGGTRAWEVPA
jgi:Fe-S-cluster-containing dehydrogenase component